MRDDRLELHVEDPLQHQVVLVCCEVGLLAYQHLTVGADVDKGDVDGGRGLLVPADDARLACELVDVWCVDVLLCAGAGLCKELELLHGWEESGK